MNITMFVATLALTSASGGLSGDAAQRITLPATPVEVAIKAGEQKTSTDPAVNPDAAAMADFKGRVGKYADLHKKLATGAAEQKKGSTPTELDAAKVALTAKVQMARTDARHGDIFTPDVRAVFRRLLAPRLKGEDGRDARAIIRDDAPEPASVPFKVNAKYPEGQPLPSVPAQLLLALPPLEAPLEYRVVGQHLLLIDTATDLIVDYILNAIVA
ncbi:MAG: hypothetical protein ABL986_03240 [Vicinamibacterales bacterium]